MRRTSSSDRQARERRLQSADVAAQDDERVVVELDGVDRVEPDQTGGERSRRVAEDAQLVRTIVERPADGVEVALGGELPVDDEEHARGQPLYLLEHVRGDENRSSLIR